MDKATAHWKKILIAVHKIKGVRLFRNNTGTGWVGQSFQLKPGQVYRAEGGERVIKHPRPLHAGLMKGSADGIGWQTVTITPDMVGQRIAIFLSVEAKFGSGRLEKDQKIWHDNVLKAGGISVIARSTEQASEEIMQGHLLNTGFAE